MFLKIIYFLQNPCPRNLLNKNIVTNDFLAFENVHTGTYVCIYTHRETHLYSRLECVKIYYSLESSTRLWDAIHWVCVTALHKAPEWEFILSPVKMQGTISHHPCLSTLNTTASFWLHETFGISSSSSSLSLCLCLSLSLAFFLQAKITVNDSKMNTIKQLMAFGKVSLTVFKMERTTLQTCNFPVEIQWRRITNRCWSHLPSCFGTRS